MYLESTIDYLDAPKPLKPPPQDFSVMPFLLLDPDWDPQPDEPRWQRVQSGWNPP